MVSQRNDNIFEGSSHEFIAMRLVQSFDALDREHYHLEKCSSQSFTLSHKLVHDIRVVGKAKKTRDCLNEVDYTTTSVYVT